jgi:hypothetical protein
MQHMQSRWFKSNRDRCRCLLDCCFDADQHSGSCMCCLDLLQGAAGCCVRRANGYLVNFTVKVQTLELQAGNDAAAT